MTPYIKHREKWKDCTRCLLHEHRRKIVLCRGKIPADVLFVGEAPGESEDVLGSPFVGPAAQLLDSLIEQAFSRVSHSLMTPADCDCGGYTGRCNICDGGLGLCKRCGKGEVELSEPCTPLRTAFTNLVACIPHNESGDKYDVPKVAIKECRPRLVELCKLVKPKLVVQVGTLAKKHWDVKDWEALIDAKAVPTFVKIDHPAFIIRSNVADQGLLIQRVVVTLSDIADKVFSDGE